MKLTYANCEELSATAKALEAKIEKEIQDYLDNIPDAEYSMEHEAAVREVWENARAKAFAEANLEYTDDKDGKTARHLIEGVAGESLMRHLKWLKKRAMQKARNITPIDLIGLTASNVYDDDDQPTTHMIL